MYGIICMPDHFILIRLIWKKQVAYYFLQDGSHIFVHLYLCYSPAPLLILSGKRKQKKSFPLFLVTRGLWLVFLEMVVLNFGWNFNITFPMFLFITIRALSICMIVLAGLIHLPKKLILVFCIVVIVGHSLFDNFHIHENSLLAFSWSLLHDQQFFTWHKEFF